tara:strand:- start:2455 stop:2649 length:195 start_codon:yes stop_codon:yes gene_type:complete
MTSEIKSYVKDRKLASFKVINYIGLYTRIELSEMLGISRPTLNKRIKCHDWRMAELKKIERKLP